MFANVLLIEPSPENLYPWKEGGDGARWIFILSFLFFEDWFLPFRFMSGDLKTRVILLGGKFVWLWVHPRPQTVKKLSPWITYFGQSYLLIRVLWFSPGSIGLNHNKFVLGFFFSLFASKLYCTQDSKLVYSLRERPCWNKREWFYLQMWHGCQENKYGRKYRIKSETEWSMPDFTYLWTAWLFYLTNITTLKTTETEMSSKLNVKQSKKERPRSSGKSSD